METATALGNVIAFPMMFLSGAFFPIEIMPDYLQVVARGMPLFYFHQGLRQLMVLDNPAQASLSFLVLGALAAVFAWVAVRVTRWREL